MDMDILQILKIIATVGTLGVGLLSLARPRSIKAFTGLDAPGPRGVTEVRAVMGGVFIGLGLAVLLLPDPLAYHILGITYITIAVIRAVSMMVDRSVEQSNIISLVVEVIFGVILVL
jgi:hypothetical protein